MSKWKQIQEFPNLLQIIFRNSQNLNFSQIFTKMLEKMYYDNW